MAKSIKFIPPQIDALAGTTTEASRKNPLRLLTEDLGVLARMLRYLPWIIIPFRTTDKTAELYIAPKNLRDIILNGWLILFESILLLVALPAFLILPGGIWLLVAIVCVIAILLSAQPMQGPRIAYSRMDERTTAKAKKHDSERWLFINGCMTGHSVLQNNIDRLSLTFGRAVIGFHNNSYGLVADLIECLIQRCLSYNTKDTRMAYDYVKACITDPTVTKLVLIGHSQGGIVTSLIVDQLLADIPSSYISKLEVYTFGSAASHFNNPRINLTEAAPRGVIPHIEHYCNEYDMVPRWGVLHNITEVLNNRYSGTVFVRMDATGHMFNQHYMDVMFPLAKAPIPNRAGLDTAEDSVRVLLDNFLDKVVDVDEKTARKRENIAIQNMGIMRRESGIEFGDGQTLPVGQIVNDDNDERARSDGDRVAIGVINAGDRAVLSRCREARGKTVRELSHLWKYLGGQSPREE